jgi:branched-subunit amino acid ABC-type transport system permease component
MGVINMAHGELMMIGAYCAYVVQLLMPNHIGWSIAVAIPVLPVDASRMVMPGRNSPRSSALLTMCRRIRSFRLELGFMNSSFPQRA